MDIKESRKFRGQLATDQQRKASNPLKSVWVQASAGTGKTKVLTDRVLRILLSGVQPGRILCLTYTKAAAVEMSSRIAARLSRWAVIPQEKLDHELEALLGSLPSQQEDLEKLEAMARKLFAILLDTPGGMKIQTIHSFCQEILKRFPLEAKISPYFEVLDERAAAEALDEIRRQLLLKIENDPQSHAGQALVYLTGQVSEFSFPKIMGAIANDRSKISRLFSKYKSPEKIEAALAERLGVSPNETAESLSQTYNNQTNFECLRSLAEGWRRGGKSDQVKAEKLAALTAAEDLNLDFEAYRSCFLTQKNEVVSRPATKDVLFSVPQFEAWFYTEADRLLDYLQKLTTLRLLEGTRAVLFLAEDLITGYNQYKAQHSKLDYEDLIVLTRRLLESPQAAQWVLFKLDGGIDNVLIDEAQDTSPDQWAIVKALTSGFFDDIGSGTHRKTVFAVGDKKQSIYSFQGADPRKFAEMEKYFSSLLEVSQSFEEVNLEVSFRSTAAVLDVVNHVFGDPSVKPGVAEENEDITHIPFRAGEAGKIELWPLTEPEAGENPDIVLPPVERVSAGTTSSKLARQIAERIKQMVDQGERLPAQGRAVCYRDFMILVQRRNSFVEELVRACKNVGVSVAGVDKIKLLEQIAVQDLIALGKFLLLPSDDQTLAEVLKSPLFGCNDDDLFRLCYNRNEVSLWSRLSKDQNYEEIFKTLKDLLARTDLVRPFELYSYVLNKLQGRQKFIERLGFEAEDGIDEFINLTMNFEQDHIPGLQSFIDWVRKDEVEIKRQLEQSEIDAVRIMTVHGSKGLQAPIVILPDTVRMPAVKNESAMLWDDLFYFPLSSRDYNEDCKKIKDRERRLTEQEYRRLLYVALTRAEDRLCICGYYNSPKSKPKDESWYKICQRSLQQLGQETAQGLVEYQTAQQFIPEEKTVKKQQRPHYPDFGWMHENPKTEDVLSKPLAPSKMEEEEPALFSPLGTGGKSRYRRGLIIHKLLQFLPETDDENKPELIQEFLLKNAPDLSASEMQRIEREVLRLLEDPQFGLIFSRESKAEVPLMGLANGKIISGQVDRLVVTPDEVWVVDYKTNRPAAEALSDVPEAYLKQMAAYRQLLAEIYPGRRIRSFILWTDTAILMTIE